MTTELPASIPVRKVRRAAALADIDIKTAKRIIAGLPTRPSGRERFLDELKKLGVSLSEPQPAKI
jgi:hypothetical protein